MRTCAEVSGKLLAEGVGVLRDVIIGRQLEGLLTRLPVNWLFAWIYNGLIPHAKLMKSIELFATEVLPRFDIGD